MLEGCSSGNRGMSDKDNSGMAEMILSRDIRSETREQDSKGLWLEGLSLRQTDRGNKLTDIGVVGGVLVLVGRGTYRVSSSS